MVLSAQQHEAARWLDGVPVTRASLFIALLAAALSTLVAPSAAQASASDYTYATRYDAARRVVGTITPARDSADVIKFAANRTTYDPASCAILIENGQLSAWQSEAVLPSSWPIWNPTTLVGFQIFSKIATS